MLTDNLELMVEPLEVKAIRNQQSGSTEVLIQWKDLPNFEATWKPVTMIQQFPEFHLEDKMAFLGDSIVRPPIKKAHIRRTHDKHMPKSHS